MDGLSTKTRSRRSFPSLGALHITPLTSEPLEPSPMFDDDEPSFSSRRSYISSRSLPQTPSILSRSSSRTRSGHSRSANKSSLALASLDDGSTPPRTPGGTGRLNRPKSALASGRQTPARVRIADAESTDFLLRTASLLVESASESKGQGWISKRNSSTSLAGFDPAQQHSQPESAYPADDEFSPTWSRRASRRNSVSATSVGRWDSRRGSRTTMGWKTPGEVERRDGYFEEMGLELAEDDGWGDEDEEEDTIDEGELRRLLRRRVGGFLEDIFGGWFDLRGEEDVQTDDETVNDAAKFADDKVLTPQQRKQRFVSVRKEDLVQVQPASEKAGVYGDARWLAGLAGSLLA